MQGRDGIVVDSISRLISTDPTKSQPQCSVSIWDEIFLEELFLDIDEPGIKLIQSTFARFLSFF
jgi:hypothetical protein